MYKQLLSEFNKLAEVMTADEMEIIAEDVINGLDKLADIEMDNLEKFADEYEVALEKQAAEGDYVAPGLAAGALGLAGAAFGVKRLKAAMPGWRADRLANKAAKAEGKLVTISKKRERALAKSKDAEESLKAGGGDPGLLGDGVKPAAATRKPIEMYESHKLEHRINPDNPNFAQTTKDAKNLGRIDAVNNWWNGDPAKLKGSNKDAAMAEVSRVKGTHLATLAGVGGTALVANNAAKNSNRDAELRGATGRR